MGKQKFDLMVIGTGPGGYVAAIRAAQLGMRVCVVERELLGGICLNWGCIPTKALLRSAEFVQMATRAKDFGFEFTDLKFDLKKIVDRSREVAARLNAGVNHLLKKNKIEIIIGHAKLLGSGRVSVEKDDQTLSEFSSTNIIIATGARARELPGLESDGDLILTYKQAMVPDKVPESILVVGSGAIGIEFASFYRALGSDITVVEVLDRILPVEDEEISKFAHEAFVKQGMHLVTNAKVTSLERGTRNVTANIDMGSSNEVMTFEKVIMAVGIIGNTENLGLENTNVLVDRGHIQVDQWMATGEPGVYAVGDIVGPPWLAHKASHEGIICVENIAGLPNVHPLDLSNIPGCTYCMPQIASVGFTESAARESGHNIKVGRFPFIANGKAIALGEDEGIIKTIFDSTTGELLGAHMIGAEVTELIQGYAIAKSLETTESELINTIFPHPTLSEMMQESVLDAYDRVIHF